MDNSEILDSIQHKIFAALFGLLVITLSMNCVFASTLSATIDRSQIAMGETLNLTLSVNTNHSSSTPDLSPLTKNFKILGTSQSSQTKIINGSRTDTVSWIVTLAPKSTGSLIIPALSIAKLNSRPITVDVVDTPFAVDDKENAAQLSMTVDIESDTHYVHEEFPITVTITDGVGIKNATLSDYEGEDFILKRSGDDKITQNNHNGSLVTTIERRYLAKPQKSGVLTFPALTLNARVNDNTKNNSFFGNNDVSDLFNQFGMGTSLFDNFINPGRALSISSEPIEIKIKQRPTANNEWFLPAKEVQLLASFDKSDPQFKVGEAVTRRIQLYALGASQEQLPDLVFENTDKVNIYIDKADTKSSQTPDGTAVIREYVTSVIPTQAGEINLPAMEVKWWDTQTDSEKVATLATETITVEGAAIMPSTIHDKAPQIPGQTQIQSQLDNPTNKPPVSTSENPAFDKMTSMPIVISLILVLAAITALLIFMKHNQNHAINKIIEGFQSKKPKSNNTSTASSNHLAAIELACHHNDIKKAYAITHKWFSQIAGSNVNSLAYRNSISPAIHNELMRMEGLLYSDKSRQDWNGNALLMAIKRYKANTHKKKSKSSMYILQPLYPASDSEHRYI